MKPLWIALAACTVWTSGCSKSKPDEPEAPPAAPAASGAPAAKQPAAAARQAIVPGYARVEIPTDAGLFWFQPRLCLVGVEPGHSEVSYSIEGAGQAPDGQPVYVTIGDEDYDPATGPELRINVGTDQPRKTPEVVWISNAHNDQVPAAKTTVQGETLQVQGAVFTRGGAERLTTQGAIRIDCTQR